MKSNSSDLNRRTVILRALCVAFRLSIGTNWSDGLLFLEAIASLGKPNRALAEWEIQIGPDLQLQRAIAPTQEQDNGYNISAKLEP